MSMTQQSSANLDHLVYSAFSQHTYLPLTILVAVFVFALSFVSHAWYRYVCKSSYSREFNSIYFQIASVKAS